jgi:hypothetical protein
MGSLFFILFQITTAMASGLCQDAFEEGKQRSLFDISLQLVFNLSLVTDVRADNHFVSSPNWVLWVGSKEVSLVHENRAGAAIPLPPGFKPRITPGEPVEKYFQIYEKTGVGTVKVKGRHGPDFLVLFSLEDPSIQTFLPLGNEEDKKGEFLGSFESALYPDKPLILFNHPALRQSSLYLWSPKKEGYSEFDSVFVKKSPFQSEYSPLNSWKADHILKAENHIAFFESELWIEDTKLKVYDLSTGVTQDLGTEHGVTKTQLEANQVHLVSRSDGFDFISETETVADTYHRIRIQTYLEALGEFITRQFFVPAESGYLNLVRHGGALIQSLSPDRLQIDRIDPENDELIQSTQIDFKDGIPHGVDLRNTFESGSSYYFTDSHRQRLYRLPKSHIDRFF